MFCYIMPYHYWMYSVTNKPVSKSKAAPKAAPIPIPIPAPIPQKAPIPYVMERISCFCNQIQNIGLLVMHTF